MKKNLGFSKNISIFVIFNNFLLVFSKLGNTDSLSEALAGSSARLTCDTSLNQGDQPQTVTWYRLGETESDQPFYTYDARQQQGNRWSDVNMGERIYMRMVSNEAQLTIDPVDASDEAQYKCKVDFRRAPSRSQIVNLTVVVPPKEIIVTDDSGTPLKNDRTMQYAEGASATLTCVASGGRPLARVSWWRGDLLLDDTDTVMVEKMRTRNILKIDKLTRKDLLSVYKCEATNSLLQPPLQVPVVIDMYLRPLDVRLLGTNAPLSAGSIYEMSCQTRGSRPKAVVQWFKDGLPLEGAITREIISTDENSTTSILSFTPQVNDSGMTLQCRVSNPRIPHSELRDTWMLHVLYTPKVTLTLGHSLNASNIKTGADVYFECHISANPWVHRVIWTHDDKRLFNNQTAGIIVSNQTLVLQSVTKTSTGVYKCVATNEEGTSDSNGISLDVKYDPVCGKNPQRVFGAAKQEQVTIECRVEANPAATVFRWTFNNTASNSIEISTFTADQPGHSLLSYTPRADSDYGTLLCWGKNSMGNQIVPCMFHIVPAGRPDPPYNCTVSNRTHHSFLVSCARGFDGGLRQRFSLLVTTANGSGEKDETVVLNITSGAVPEFTVTGLESGQQYTLRGYAYNEKGWSRASLPLVVSTLMEPNSREERRSTVMSLAPTAAVTMWTSTWVYIAVGLVGTLLVAGIGIGAAIRIDCSRRPNSDTSSDLGDIQQQPKPPSGHEQHEIKSFNVIPLEEASDPDLILLTDTTSVSGYFDKDPYCPHLYGPTYAPYTISTGSVTTASCSGLQSCLSNAAAVVSPAVAAGVATLRSKRNCATQMPVKPYHVTWAPDTRMTESPPLPPQIAQQICEMSPVSLSPVQSIRHHEPPHIHRGPLDTIPENSPPPKSNAQTQTAPGPPPRRHSELSRPHAPSPSPSECSNASNTMSQHKESSV